MRKTVLALATIGILATTQAYEMGQNEGYEQASNKSEIQMQHVANQMMKMNTSVIKTLQIKSCDEGELLAEDGSCVHDKFWDETVSEKFKITDIEEDAMVRGEKTEGTGEGIYYPMSLFIEKGADKIQVGDTVRIEWLTKDFIEENWDNVHQISEVY